MTRARSAFTANTSPAAAAQELIAGLEGVDPRVVVFFAGLAQGGGQIGAAPERRVPRACVVGCSGNGEFSDGGHGKDGAAALAISRAQIGACATAMIADDDIDAGVRRAADQISARLGRSLRELDPARWGGWPASPCSAARATRAWTSRRRTPCDWRASSRRPKAASRSSGS